MFIFDPLNMNKDFLTRYSIQESMCGKFLLLCRMHWEKCLLFTAVLIEFIKMDVHAFGIILPTLII